MSTVLDFVPGCRFGLILERVDRWIYKKNICVSVHVHVYKLMGTVGTPIVDPRLGPCPYGPVQLAR